MHTHDSMPGKPCIAGAFTHIDNHKHLCVTNSREINVGYKNIFLGLGIELATSVSNKTNTRLVCKPITAD